MKHSMTVEVELSAPLLAEMFCEMDDEQQTQFFCAVGRIMQSWPPLAREMQPHAIANHLARCECSSEEGRWFVREIARVI